MIIALQKKKENIAEYLLYMWQVEDLLRACQLDETTSGNMLTKRFGQYPSMTEATMSQIRQWYLDLNQMMLSEGKRESGHLQINENVIIELTDLHLRLLKSGQDAIYTSCYYSTLPIIVELRSKSGAEKKGEIETCFTALYGKLLLHLQGKEVTSETDLAMRQISKFVGLLAEKYRMYKNGELDLD